MSKVSMHPLGASDYNFFDKVRPTFELNLIMRKLALELTKIERHETHLRHKSEPHR
jgi:hypothetical protein